MHSEWPYIHLAGDLLVRAGLTLGPRAITDYELVYFQGGSDTVYETRGRAYTLDRPGFVFTRPGERHRYRFDPVKHVRHAFVHFDWASFEEPDGPMAPLLRADWLPIGADRFGEAAMKRLLAVANEQGPRWEARMAALLAALLEELCHAAAGPAADAREAGMLPLPIVRALAYMDDHLGEGVTVEAIARRSGWSHAHFTRVFAACVGMSPKRALMERRVARAEQLMLEGRLAIKEIAYELGFADVHHFSRAYKAARGYTATAYIAKCQDPLFRNTASAAADPDTPYPLNRYVIVNEEIKNIHRSSVSRH
ncbi:AraC family transcriptional regulator [Paenibacillus sacheonensis]|uniref:Helix-turn-helix domain-containing protein n=1 Tax=Paenibacillus sacheonensis TaxID=742054 RepID=A0A7X4YQX2_9BACL|nr:AraC family transcriptional regulator [Paenibacillus sacheonensis]MBM7567179.1 AraC-like DNA-binding protein [Paenibacillus sacheonensis]NBC70895.1 helix-turn-helix domain-containing protein [Paenibacillus sacheonensis]